MHVCLLLFVRISGKRVEIVFPAAVAQLTHIVKHIERGSWRTNYKNLFKFTTLILYEIVHLHPEAPLDELLLGFSVWSI